MDKERFQKQIAFILEADKEKQILRQTHISSYARQENDAEHAWHMALMIYLLREYANDDFDLTKAMVMALIHDVVEIDAGDTYAYDVAALASQTEREARAAERIFGLLPEDQKAELRALFEEFEAGKSPEARFARAMDNLQPLLLNDANGGGDWRRHDICATKVRKRQERSRLGSEEIWQFAQSLIDKHVALGNLHAEETEQEKESPSPVICALTDKNARDLHTANQPFDVIGKLRLRLADGKFEADELLYDTVTRKQYPNYDGATAEEYISDPKHAAFLAYRGAACVGQIHMAESWNGCVRIEGIGVAENARGCGIGSALLEQAVRWAREKGLPTLSAECQDNNLLASRFLRKHGFSIGGVDVDLYKNLGQPYEDETTIFWYKKLCEVKNR